MTFEYLVQNVAAQFEAMQQHKLFFSDVEKDILWQMYMDAFDEKDNPVFRNPEFTYHFCNNDRHFMNRYGHVVAINDDLEVLTMWDNVPERTPYTKFARMASSLIKECPVKSVFYEDAQFLNSMTYDKFILGKDTFIGYKPTKVMYTEDKAFGNVNEGEVYTFNFFRVPLKARFAVMDADSKMSAENSGKEAFKNGLNEISTETLDNILDLAKQGALLNIDAYINSIKKFKSIAKNFDKFSQSRDINETRIELWLWRYTDESVARFKNSLVGTLCVEMTQTDDLEQACRKFNIRVDPKNYKRAVSPVTQKQINAAKQFFIENGYESAFQRRFASKEDIDINEIIHTSQENKKTASVFDVVSSSSKKSSAKGIENAKEISVEEFFHNVLPKANSMEAYFDSTLRKNLVALTTSEDKDVNPIFKWGNNFGWTFTGNIAGESLIKEAVKSRGGGVGDINFRIHFPDTISDLDLRVIEPHNYEIYYGNLREKSPCGGILDLDAQGVDGHQPAEKRVENVTYKDASTMKDGNYKIYTNYYNKRDVITNFTAEVEIFGEVTTTKCDTKSNGQKNVTIGILDVKDGKYTFTPDANVEIISSHTVKTKVWNIDTSTFHPVTLVCNSPNYWGDNNGHKHFMFMLDGCRPDENLSSFHIEFLKDEFKPHRHFLQSLSNTLLLEPVDRAVMAGLGFNATIRKSVVVKVNINSSNKLFKINF